MRAKPCGGACRSARALNTGRRSVPLALLLAACSGAEPPEPVSLVDHAVWETGRLEADPQAAHAPATIDCAPGTYHTDGLPPLDTFEVTTGDCNFLTASQPSASAIEAGDTVHLIVWHLDLDATLPGPGHVAVSIDGEVLWEVTVEVPSRAQLFDAEVVAPRAFARGATVVFHVHNHGTNEWNVQTIERR